jgi:hypothetical protein
MDEKDIQRSANQRCTKVGLTRDTDRRREQFAAVTGGSLFDLQEYFLCYDFDTNFEFTDLNSQLIINHEILLI